MKSHRSRLTILLFLSLLALPAVRTKAQVVPPLDKITSQAELDKAITALDTQLFHAYNHCDLAKFASLLDRLAESIKNNGSELLLRVKIPTPKPRDTPKSSAPSPRIVNHKRFHHASSLAPMWTA
jgi:hypothetical protein